MDIGSLTPFRMFQFVLYVLIWLIGTVSCLLVMFVVLRNSKQFKAITSVFLLNLAVADFVNLQGIPFFLSNLVNRQWLFSLFVCKLYYTMTGVNQYTMVFILTLMAFDRYLAICRPKLQKWRDINSSKHVLILVWLLSITCLLPVIIFSNLDTAIIGPKPPPSFHYGHHHNHLHHHQQHHQFDNQSSEYNQSYHLNHTNHFNHSTSNYSFQDDHDERHLVLVCTIMWPQTIENLDVVFTLYSFLVSFCLPIVLICISYTCIIIRLKRTRSEVSPQLRAKQKERRKVTYLVLAIIGIYTITYTPYWVMQIVLLVYYLFGQQPEEIPSSDRQALRATLGALFQLLVYSNSALNPFIYAFMSVNFRSNFRETFKCDKMFTLFRHFFHRLLTHRPPQTSTQHPGIEKSSQASALPTKLNRNNNTTLSPLVGENQHHHRFIELSNPFSTTNRI